MAAARGSRWDVGLICFHIKFLLGEMAVAPGSERLHRAETSLVLPVWLLCPGPSAA